MEFLEDLSFNFPLNTNFESLNKFVFTNLVGNQETFDVQKAVKALQLQKRHFLFELDFDFYNKNAEVFKLSFHVSAAYDWSASACVCMRQFVDKCYEQICQFDQL